MKNIWNVVKTTIEGLWEAAVFIYNLPVAIIEILWLLVTDRDRLRVNISYLKQTIKDNLHR